MVAGAGAGRRVARIHRRASRGRPRRSSWRDPDVLALFSVMGFSFSGAAPEPGHHVRPPEAVRGARGGRALGRRRCSDGSAARCSAFRARSSSASRRRRFPGLSRFGGFEFQVLDQTRHRHHEPGAGDAGDGGGRQPVAEAARAVQLVHGQRSAAAGDDRPAAGARARPAAQRDHQRDADLPRVAVRERLRVQQPRLPRVRAGGPAIPVEPAGAESSSTRGRATGEMVPLEQVVRREGNRPRRR